ncbi:hypothetical protein DC3_33600 [Deinococcus cellulosilyticus NBRC 106333 = KACC 11606]|uniref:Uncharacterized protein n=1 Tax=Deinococcus cellulosilyticus (strain DSM 18568 / NBRC 106333 / KACC 11606 / 5516J-15) TaxID=1223518 RepID=A0A511N4G4_DEIC1|nr:hypothetical protein DC3_33600 [Deinococcus cellulosilyticus NBRC 106333 = KACC 11606]
MARITLTNGAQCDAALRAKRAAPQARSQSKKAAPQAHLCVKKRASQ